MLITNHSKNFTTIRLKKDIRHRIAQQKHTKFDTKIASTGIKRIRNLDFLTQDN